MRSLTSSLLNISVYLSTRLLYLKSPLSLSATSPTRMPSSSCSGSDFSHQAVLLRGFPPHPGWSPPPYAGHPPAWVPSSPRVGSDTSHRAPLSNVQVVLCTLSFDHFFVYLLPQRSATPPSWQCVQFFLIYCLFQCQVHRRRSIHACWKQACVGSNTCVKEGQRGSRP